MDDESFDVWLGAIGLMNHAQRRKVFIALTLAEAAEADLAESDMSADVIVDFPAATNIERVVFSDDVCKTDVITLPPTLPVEVAARKRVDHAGCPHCGGRNLQRWGRSSGLPRYRCGACRRTFNGLTGTPLARLRKKEHWADQAEALISGESLVKAAERCGVACSTAFRWRHRFLTAPSLDKPKELSGIVEADETFLLESFKGKRSDLPRAARKRGGKASKRGLSSEQIPILVARDRAGATIDAVLPKLNKASVIGALSGVVTSSNQLCCDGGKAIVGFARKAQIPCHILPAPGKPRPEAPAFHINNVNGYHGRFKEWLSRFHGVATKYLDHYLGWRRTIEALGSSVQTQALLQSAMLMGPYQQLTT
jgi:transposase-like protein